MKTEQIQHHRNFIGGEWVPASGGARYAIHNPARPRECLGEFADSTEADVATAIDAARSAADAWANTPPPQRGAVLFRFAQLLEESRTELARIITLEQGKALAEAAGEVGRAAAEARFMAGEASRAVGQTFPSERPGYTCHTIAEPLGVVAAISPWNFPVITPVRKIAPALTWGNTVVFKPSSLTPWSAVFLMQLLEKAGLPPRVVNLVTGPGARVGDALVRDHRIDGITFTGSTIVGTHDLRGCGATAGASSTRAWRQESGGRARLSGSRRRGAGDRRGGLSVQRPAVHGDQPRDRRRATGRDAGGADRGSCDPPRGGDGLDPGTTMGPLVSHGQLRSVDRYVRQGVESGAALLTGGRALTETPESDGYYYAPTVFDRVAPDSPLAVEEIFGPVLPILRVQDLDQAIAIANGTRYGLAASLFTSRPGYVQEFTRRVQAGMIHVNHGTASQAHVPFGGVKDSGQGAYSIGPSAREFYTNVKAVYVRW